MSTIPSLKVSENAMVRASNETAAREKGEADPDSASESPQAVDWYRKKCQGKAYWEKC